jgi:PAS domain S-box-containing protein
MVTDQTKSSYELLLRISRELANTLELKQALTKVILLSMSNVGAERGSLIAINQKQDPIEAVIITETDRILPTNEEQIFAVLGRGLAGRVIKTQQPVWIPDTSKDERWLQRPDDAIEKSGAKSAVCLTLKARDQLVGVLTIVHPQPNYFSEEQFELLKTIADLAGIFIHNASLYDSLQASNQRYQELFEDSIDPIFITDWEGTILEINRQGRQCVGTLDGVFKHTIQEFHVINWHEVGENYALLRAGKTASYESEMSCHGQKMIPVDIHVHKVIINDVEVLQWIVRDVSERKSLDALREDLMAMIYHDLRSPLANIISSLDILNALLPQDDPSISPIYQIAVRSTERMQRLINSLLDIKRLEAGQPIANIKKVNVSTLINESIETVEPASSSKQQTIISKNSGDEIVIEADENMIKRVLINILENAIKFSAVDESIEIGSQLEGENLLIWVKDSGPGIPDEARDRIFNKFSRMHAQQFPKGIGLGLAFCKLAVNAHGGKIWVDSELGIGSQFNILLPLTHEIK